MTRVLIAVATLFAMSGVVHADADDDDPPAKRKKKKAVDDEDPNRGKNASGDDEEPVKKRGKTAKPKAKGRPASDIDSDDSAASDDAARSDDAVDSDEPAKSTAPARSDDRAKSSDDARKSDDDDDDAATGDDEPSARRSSRSGRLSGGDLVAVGSPKARMTLPGGKLMFNVIAEANMAKGAAGKPLSIAPDLWIGVADRLTFGIVHSGRGATGFLSGFGTGLCFRGGGDMGACALGLGDVYTFAGAEARVGLTEGGFALALVLGGQARAFDPELVLSGKGGFIARLSSKRIAIELAPMAYIGITQRKVGGMEFNRDEFGMPVTIFLRLAPSFAIALQSGVAFILKKPGDTYRVPAAAGLAWWISPHFSIDVAFGLAAVADKDDMTKAFDQRSATLGLGYAL